MSSDDWKGLLALFLTDEYAGYCCLLFSFSPFRAERTLKTFLRFLHQPAQWIHRRPFHGSVCEKGWTQGVVDVEVASEVQHGRPLDQSRRREIRRLAGMDERAQRLLIACVC